MGAVISQTASGEVQKLRFVSGILGFEEIHHYSLQEHAAGSPFQLLRADSGSPTFVVIDPALVWPGYSVQLDREEVQDLSAEGDIDAAQVQVLAIVTVPSDPAKTAVNLKAPILINAASGLAKQVVLDRSEYPLRYPLFASPLTEGREAVG